jgi:predicted kinase
MRHLAAAGGWRFLILDFRTGNDLALRRIEARRRRGGDPSDADGAVLQRQILSREPLSRSEERISLPVGEDDGSGSDRPEERSGDENAEWPEWLVRTLLERLDQPQGPEQANGDGGDQP